MNNKLISINQAAQQGIERLRQPKWVTPEDHVKIDIIVLPDGSKEPRLWAKLYAPFNLECNGKDPVNILLLQMDCDANKWLAYTGILPESDEYKAAQARYKGVLEK